MLAACTEPGTAAHLCANLSVNGVRGWFLPSTRRAGADVPQPEGRRHRRLSATPAYVDNFTYWASSQQTADMAVHIDFADLGRLHGDDKDFPRRVRAIRAI